MSTQSRLTFKAFGSALFALLVASVLWWGVMSATGAWQSSAPAHARMPSATLPLVWSSAATERMPNMADGNDCVMCRAAPGTAPPSMSEKTKAVWPTAWYVHGQAPVDGFECPGLHPTPIAVPARIVFCRWLN
jgi:hypothetical protein